jgi:ribosome-binding ATPase YchF (GTP1/OBG family)
MPQPFGATDHEFAGDEGLHPRPCEQRYSIAASTRRWFPSSRASKPSWRSSPRKIATSFSTPSAFVLPSLDRLIQASYELLGLQTYFMAIHTDFERAFIRAETVGLADFVASGGLKEARDRGLVRSEGKEYVVQDAT